MTEFQERKIRELEKQLEKIKKPGPPEPSPEEIMDVISAANDDAEKIIAAMRDKYPDKASRLTRLYREQFECTIRRYTDALI